MKHVITLLALAGALAAQTGRTVGLTLTDAVNPPATQYNYHRAAGPCSGTAAFVKVNSTPTGKSYDDVGVVPGLYCYRVTAVLAGLPESEPSDSLNVLVPLAKPGRPDATVQVAYDLQFRFSADAKRVQAVLIPKDTTKNGN